MSLCVEAFPLLWFLLPIQVSTGYYASPSKLSFFDSAQFCTEHCSSDLASIHNKAHNDDALYQARNVTYLLAQTSSSTDDIWFGLTAYFDGYYTYRDQSSFDFGNVSLYTAYPWDASKPSPSIPNSVKFNSNNLWQDDDSSNEHRFLCNSCDGVLNKYILSPFATSWSGARAYCQSTIGTDLASFHGDRDVEEGDALCGDSACWIGLNDIETEGEYKWADGSSYVYGDDVSGGVEPWDELQPNTTSNADCVSLHEYRGGGVKRLSALWRTSDCESSKRALCAMPNELCEFKSFSWSVLNGDWSPNGCVDVAFNEDTMAVITDKIWNNEHAENGNSLLVIEYTMMLLSALSDSNSAGVMVYNLPAICDYYFVYISFNPSTIQSTVGIAKFSGDTEQLLASKIIAIGLYSWVTLHIEIRNGTVFTVWTKANGRNIQQISSVADYLPSVAKNVRVGIRNEAITMRANSLYISGTIRLENGTMYESQCSSSPSMVPSFSPSSTTSLPPTSEPTGLSIVEPSDSTSGTPTATPLKTEDSTISPTTSTHDHPASAEYESTFTDFTPPNSDTEDSEKSAAGGTFVIAVIGVSGGVFLIGCGICVIVVYRKHHIRKANDSGNSDRNDVDDGNDEEIELSPEIVREHNEDVQPYPNALEVVVCEYVHLNGRAVNAMDEIPAWRRDTLDPEAEEMYVKIKREETEGTTRSRDDKRSDEDEHDDGNPFPEGDVEYVD